MTGHHMPAIVSDTLPLECGNPAITREYRSVRLSWNTTRLRHKEIDMGSMASAAANDFAIGVGLKENVGGRHSGFSRRTEARKAREQDAIDNFQLYKEDDRPRQPAPARAAPAVTTTLAQ
jgi:hypothetical protein